ncbi:MAG: hypothetical protein WAV09_01435 [Minisyncoccia bacterium]
MDKDARQLTLDLLTVNPRFRERAHAREEAAKYLMETHGRIDLFGYHFAELSQVTTFSRKLESMLRYWRFWLEHREDLRGADFLDGRILAEEAMIALEYVPGHAADKRLLERII